MTTDKFHLFCFCYVEKQSPSINTETFWEAFFSIDGFTIRFWLQIADQLNPATRPCLPGPRMPAALERYSQVAPHTPAAWMTHPTCPLWVYTRSRGSPQPKHPNSSYSQNTPWLWKTWNERKHALLVHGLQTPVQPIVRMGLFMYNSELEDSVAGT